MPQAHPSADVVIDPQPPAPDLPRHSRPLSRRRLFGALGLGTMGSIAGAARATAPPDAAADLDPGSLASKLARRITMGVTSAELAKADSLGYQGYLEYQLNYTAIPEDPDLLARLALLTTLTMNPVDLFPLNGGQVSNELIEACMVRAIWSTRQLFERMVEFWTDHFNIDILNETDQYLKTVDDREVIRPHALGKFPDMLRASAHSPAMLYYLSNTVNRVGSPNENYARELMELHSLGVDGGYTQQDVVEVARCFTGWGMYGRTGDAAAGTFRYRASDHDNGQKIVLGNVIAAGGGPQDGETVLQILADHPSTARFIATKLCKWLLSETPPAPAIDRAAAAYSSTGGDIKAMIRAALAPAFLADAPLKYKRPFHVFMSALRTVPVSITSTSSLRSRLNAAGQVPFYWSPPDGYPDRLDYWAGLVISRWNFGASLMANQINGVTVDHASFFSGATTANEVMDRINQRVFLGELPVSEYNRILMYISPGPPTESQRREALGLAFGSPNFQWY